ncbi:threonylcarbamoyladenosine tRNA methylthiotransferase [Lycorma delicatula]|uniref:threonylcarbamoyladenosine tRNA methylthiotransferase n=1 Tax=Lycorma delicatula TaxID=130591 RepID=UPI003F51789C
MPSVCNEIIDDIEDLISSQDITPKERYNNRHSVTVRVKKKNRTDKPKSDLNGNVSEDSKDDLQSSIIPGTQSVYVKTWGCTHNSSDSEYMAGQLAAYGYKLTDNKMAADLWLLNSCTVKNPAEDHFRNEIEAGHKAGKSVVVAGCVPQGAPKAQFLKGLSIIGVQQIDRVVEVVEETLKGHSVRLLGQKKSGGRKMGGASLTLPKVRKNPLIEIIPINTGCLNQCTYCKTKHARGDLGSYPPEEIVERARQSFSEGVCELWLTSEDTGTYGRDIGSTLPELLWKIIDVIPPNCMMRVGMTNPPYILEYLEEMGKILSHPRVYSFLHVPVQSGSDCVLTDMKREYSRADFEMVVDVLREKVPGVSIATDVICGFPTETKEDFEETISLCEKYKFPSLFINQFYPRPGTPAARLPRLPAAEMKQRTKRITELFRSYELYGPQIGSKQEVLVTEEAYDGQHYVGHNKFYHQVLVDKNPNWLGKMVLVEIISATKHSMNGKVLCIAGETPASQINLFNSLNKFNINNNNNNNVNNVKFSIPYTIYLIGVVLFAKLLWILFL